MANISVVTLSATNSGLLAGLTTEETGAVIGGISLTTIAQIGTGLASAGAVLTGIATIGTLIKGSGATSGSAAVNPGQLYAQSEIISALSEPDWNPLTGKA